MGETESRTVETKYTAVDAGYGATVGRISSAFESGARQADKFRLKMGELRAETGFSTLGMLGLGAGIGAWVEKAKEAQTEFAGAQKSVAAVLSTTLQFAKGTTEIDRYRRSFQLSSHVVEEAEETAGRFNMSLTDVTGVYRSLALSAGQFGLSQKQVSDLMIETSATAKRFGVSGEYAAATIARALRTGSVRGVDEFSLSLARAMGNMHKLGQAARFDHIQKALRGSMTIADEMSQGMGANIARAQMEVTAVFRDATGPVFKQIGTSISAWAKHIKEVRENGRSLIDDFGGKLVTAFNVLKDVSGFIKDHWVSIGAVFGTLKAIDLTKSWSGSLAAMAASRAGTGVGALAGVGAGGFAGLASSILPVVGALAAFKVGLDGVLDVIEGYVDKSREKDNKASFGMGSVDTMMHLLAKQREVGVLDAKTSAIGKSTVAELAKYGLVANGKLDQGGITAAITRMSSGDREQWATKLGIRSPYMPVSQMSGDQFSKAIVAQLGGIVAQYATAAKTAATGIVDDKAVKFAKQVNNFNGGIHITQKFEDANPDAVFIRFRDDVMREVGSRTQALTSDPQGD